MFPYRKEYHAHLLYKESRNSQRHQFRGRSPQMSYRKYLIKSLKQLSDKLGLAATTFHVAVHLLDYFMDSHGIEPHQLTLTATSCLFLSAKFVDVDANVPRISQLRSLNNDQNSTYEFKVMEIMLLNFWKWDLNCTTSLHFLEHLMTTNSFLSSNEESSTTSNFPNSFNTQATDLVNLTLLESQFINYKHSVVAASCLAVKRIQYKLFPIWSAAMETVTSYSLTDLCLCIQDINQLILKGSLNPFTKAQLLPRCSLMLKVDKNKREKSKAPVTSHGVPTIKKQMLIDPRDLKSLYFAVQ